MILTTGKVVAPCLLDKTGFILMNSVWVFTLLEAQKIDKFLNSMAYDQSSGVV